MAEEFTQNKPRLKVLALGHEGCGKTTLAAAVQHVMLLDNGPVASAAPKGKSLWSRLSSALSGDAPSPGLTPAPAAALPGPGMQQRSIEWLDFPADEVADRIAGAGASGNLALALVVSAADGPLPQTREHIQAAKRAGAPGMTVFLNQCDKVDDEEMLHLVELEVRELLDFCGYDGAGTIMIRGSAQQALQARSQGDPWAAKVHELLAALELARAGR